MSSIYVVTGNKPLTAAFLSLMSFAQAIFGTYLTTYFALKPDTSLVCLRKQISEANREFKNGRVS